MTTHPAVKPTLADVAQRAQVSLATASKVANGRPDVAAGTRTRVEQAIQELGYETSRRKNDATRPSIAFLADMITSPYAMEVLRGAVAAAEDLDIDLVVERTHRRTDPDGTLTSAALTHRLLSANRIGAVLLTAGVGGQVYSTVLGARIPLVVIDPLDSEHPDIVSVGATNWLGGRSVAEHLLALGHTRIAAIGGPQRSMSASARLDGFLSACRSAGTSVPERWLRRIGWDADEAYAVAASWLSDSTELPTAIVAANDTQAMGVLRAAHDVGLRIPDQLSVVGYDDSPLASWSSPPLTTVRQPLADIGRRAVETAHRIHRGREPESRHIELSTTLVIRRSAARPSEQQESEAS